MTVGVRPKDSRRQETERGLPVTLARHWNFSPRSPRSECPSHLCEQAGGRKLRRDLLQIQNILSTSSICFITLFSLLMTDLSCYSFYTKMVRRDRCWRVFGKGDDLDFDGDVVMHDSECCRIVAMDEIEIMLRTIMDSNFVRGICLSSRRYTGFFPGKNTERDTRNHFIY